MNYRNRVIESLHMLEDVRNQIFTQVVNLASDGEMKEVMNVFEDGDYFTFEMSQFEDMKDLNINKLMLLCKDIEKVFDSIQNVNAVRDEEIFINED